MGADMNARDIMACTPLQNAAHGTYSALAAVPAAGGATANGAFPIRSGRVLPCSLGTPLRNTNQSLLLHELQSQLGWSDTTFMLCR